MQGGIFFPCISVRVCGTVVVFALHFILSDAEVQSWRSVLLKWRAPLKAQRPRGVSAAVLRALVAVVLAPATSLAGTWEHQEFSLQTVLLWALLQKPLWVRDASRTALMGKGDSRVNQVSVSPDFCYTGLESSWEVLPACVVAFGVFLHWVFLCGSTCSAGTQLTKGDSGITSTWKSTNCT